MLSSSFDAHIKESVHSNNGLWNRSSREAQPVPMEMAVESYVGVIKNAQIQAGRRWHGK